MKTEEKDGMGVKVLKVISTIFLTLTILSGAIFILNLGNSCMDSSADYITPMTYFISFGVMTLLTRLSEYK